jgi:hypothetical protein
MTGNFTLTLPIMLAGGIASQVARRISYGSIYTTKLLRRGIDIERPKAISALQALTVEEVMQPLEAADGHTRLFGAERATAHPAIAASDCERLIGPVTLTRRPQALFAEEDLDQAPRSRDLRRPPRPRAATRRASDRARTDRRQRPKPPRRHSSRDCPYWVAPSVTDTATVALRTAIANLNPKRLEYRRPV